MNTANSTPDVIDSGTLTFTIESRVLRELGERLVKQPEVALLELVKNAYDADATVCAIRHEPSKRIVVEDDGHGMTLDEFKNGWMRIGTSSKASASNSRQFRRIITGEKGIGRFAVRFLGKSLDLESVAFDRVLKTTTLLTATFDWHQFDLNEDLGKVTVPYQLMRIGDQRAPGTRLSIGKLRPNATDINLYAVRTASISIVTPYQSLLKEHRSRDEKTQDPGFTLSIEPTSTDTNDGNVARVVLDAFVLKAIVELKNDRLGLTIYRRGKDEPSIDIVDKYPSALGSVYADIRFFPQRKGTFTGLSVDGRRAKSWVKEHSGVAVFDRTFRVHPYGLESDDWLSLSADTAKRTREPRSTIAKKHFPMDEPTRMSTQLNYMLRLPYPQQLVGVVQVKGRRTQDDSTDDDGLIAAADREGFVNNAAFQRLRDLVRGATEAIASADREMQQERERAEQQGLLSLLRKETREAIKEIEANPNITRSEKVRITRHLAQTQVLAQEHEERSRQRESTLEVMSLLGVVAGFMTHEFGIALDELTKAQKKLLKLARRDNEMKDAADKISEHIDKLRDFVTYSQGYIQGAASRPGAPYPARPRIKQVIRVFGQYAKDRGIVVEPNIDADVSAPLVPVSLYNGIALNLFTNALKAITAKSGDAERKVVFRAWNEQNWHNLEVSDTGIGIPVALRHRVFDPLFTTTASNRDPLGSGMGLGLALVKRGVEGYGGRVDVVDPPAGFTTCVRVRLPLSEDT